MYASFWRSAPNRCMPALRWVLDRSPTSRRCQYLSTVLYARHAFFILRTNFSFCQGFAEAAISANVNPHSTSVRRNCERTLDSTRGEGEEVDSFLISNGAVLSQKSRSERMAITVPRLLPYGRRTGRFSSASQRWTVRTPRFKYAAISFHEFNTSREEVAAVPGEDIFPDLDDPIPELRLCMPH